MSLVTRLSTLRPQGAPHLVTRHSSLRPQGAPVLCKTETRLYFCTLAGDLEVSTGGTDWISFRHTARWLST